MNRSEEASQAQAIGFCWTANDLNTRTARIGRQMGAGFAECAATQREQRIGESVALALKWT